MNIRLDLKIPNITDPTKSIELVLDTLLTPFYITERELLSIYLETYANKYYYEAREIIFYASIKADEIINDNLSYMTQKELLITKKHLAECLAIIAFGTKFNVTYISSLSRSKTFANFTVSTSVKNDPQFIKHIIDTAKECVESIELMLEDNSASIGAGASFVKGARNASSRTSHRLWSHSGLPFKSFQHFASGKKWYKNQIYKDGADPRDLLATSWANTDYYSELQDGEICSRTLN
jgi:hypothetical protein